MYQINFVLSEIEKQNVSYIEKYFPKKFIEHQINIPSFKNTGNEKGEHYKLLNYISSLYNDILILDLGTRDGLSALTLAYNNQNRVITYDINIKPNEMKKFEDIVPNLTFKQMNIFDEDISMFHKAKIIFMDLDPHDGLQENAIIKILDSISWDGILIADDIEWFLPMKIWFNNLNKIKYNLTKYAHGSGTGLIDFNNNLNII